MIFTGKLKRIGALSIAMAILLGSFHPVYALTLTVTGEAVVQNGDESAAKEEAIVAAFRKAVEEGIGTIVASNTLIENYQVISDKIFTKARGYVKNYKILNGYVVGGRYKVEMSVEVSEQNIQDDLIALNILQQAKDNPRIMIIISEEHLGRRVPVPTSEIQMIKRFIEKDFKVVDQEQSKKIRESDQMKAILQGDVSAAAQIGMEYGAEVIIVGQAFSESAADIYSMKSCRATIAVRVIRCDTADILAADEANGSGADIADAVAGKKALSAAAGKLSETIIGQIVKKWSAEVIGGESVQLTVNGISFSQLKVLKKYLLNKARIKEVHQRSFQAGSAKLDLDTKNNAQSLADKLSEASSELGFDLEIVGLTANKVELKVNK